MTINSIRKHAKELGLVLSTKKEMYTNNYNYKLMDENGEIIFSTNDMEAVEKVIRNEEESR